MKVLKTIDDEWVFIDKIKSFHICENPSKLPYGIKLNLINDEWYIFDTFETYEEAKEIGRMLELKLNGEL